MINVLQHGTLTTWFMYLTNLTGFRNSVVVLRYYFLSGRARISTSCGSVVSSIVKHVTLLAECLAECWVYDTVISQMHAQHLTQRGSVFCVLLL